MSTFITPNYFDNAGIISPTSTELYDNFRAIQIELNAVSNLASEAVTTADIADNAVTGNKINIDYVLQEDHLLSVLSLTERIYAAAQDPIDLYDTNYVLGEVEGSDTLIWDSGSWAISGGDSPTWAMAPRFEMISGGSLRMVRSKTYKVYEPSFLQFQLNKSNSDNTMVAIYVTTDQTLTAASFNNKITTSGVVNHTSNLERHPSNWANIPGFMVAYLDFVIPNAEDQGFERWLSDMVFINASQDNPLMFQIRLYKIIDQSEGWNVPVQNYDLDTILSKVRIMPISKPQGTVTIIESMEA